MPDYETKRLQRRREMARTEARNFEDQLSQHELILMRLDALPVDLQEANHEEVRAGAMANVERIKSMVAAMREEAGPEEHETRQVRRAREREEAKTKG